MCVFLFPARPVRVFLQNPNVYFHDNSGAKVFWPFLFNTEGGLRFGCSVCMQYNAGVQLSFQNVISRGMLDVKPGKLSKATIDGHVRRGIEGDHGKRVANYKLVMKLDNVDDEGGIAGQIGKRAVQEPSIQILNHFSWLYLALALPVSSCKFSSMIRMANDTGSDIMTNQYLEKHFFTEGMKCFDIVLSEAVLTTLKKSRRVAWHIDVGGGVLLIRFYALSEQFRRVSHYVQGRTVATHTADGLFAGFVDALTQPTANVPNPAIRLTEQEVYNKTAIFLADGASVMGVRKKGGVLVNVSACKF